MSDSSVPVNKRLLSWLIRTRRGIAGSRDRGIGIYLVDTDSQGLRMATVGQRRFRKVRIRRPELS
jgi:hypothetical protein